MNKYTLIMILLITLWALGLRLLAAREAYPVPGDASHFVQHGVALAHGVPGALSTYWSQGMTTLAAAATKLGMNPRYFLQGVALLAGVYVVLGGMLIMLRLVDSRLPVGIYGLWAATNPALIHYSTTGYSEMPYMAILVLAVHVGLIARARPGSAWLLTLLSGALLGVAGYFKGLDAVVAVGSFCLFHLALRVGTWTDAVRRCALLSLAPLIVLLPLCLFTYQQTGKFTPGSKGTNLSSGLDWSDSKKVYATDGKIFRKSPQEVLYEIPGRLRANVPDLIRIINGLTFARGFRMGTLWFALLAGGGLWAAWRAGGPALLPVLMLFPQLMLLSLVFIHGRIVVPGMPWVLMIGTILLAMGWRAAAPGGRAVLLVLGVLFASGNSLYARRSFEQEFFYWRYQNTVQVADRMKAFANDHDVIMTYDGTLAALFYKYNPLLVAGLPYGSLGEVEAMAARQDVDYLVVSDALYGHWPIAAVFNPATQLPPNWSIIDVLTFDQNTAAPGAVERICIIRRTGHRADSRL